MGRRHELAQKVTKERKALLGPPVPRDPGDLVEGGLFEKEIAEGAERSRPRGISETRKTASWPSFSSVVIHFAHAAPSGVRRQAKYWSSTASASALGTGPTVASFLK